MLPRYWHELRPFFNGTELHAFVDLFMQYEVAYFMSDSKT
jgi:hypothetical protein